jgi:hypothetical protein
LSVSDEFVSSARVKVARTVLAFAPDSVPNVLSGSVSLDENYKTARERKQAI